MGTIKILGFDEDGNAQRLKIRIARFLDYDPVTASDKSNIRSTLGITSQGGLGDLLAANNLDDVASLDTTKANLEIPDVGTAPNQVPTMGMLGTMSVQDADSVSMGTVSADEIGVGVTDPNAKLHVSDDSAPTLRLSRTGTGQIWQQSIDSSGRLIFQEAASEGGTKYTRAVLDDDGNFGVGTDSPAAGAVGGKVVHVQSTGETASVRVDRSDASTAGTLSLTAGNSTLGVYGTGSKDLVISTNGATRWRIDGSNGNLIANGTAIDFGSTNSNTGVTVSGSVMSEYEQGTFTPKLTDASTGGNEATIGTVGADYIRVGNQVFFAMRLIDINTTGLTSGNAIYITDMPYVCKSGSSFVPFNVMADTLTFGGQLVGVIEGGKGYANLRQFSNGAGDSAVPVSAISSGATDLFISGSYLVA